VLATSDQLHDFKRPTQNADFCIFTCFKSDAIPQKISKAASLQNDLRENTKVQLEVLIVADELTVFNVRTNGRNRKYTV
jgi:hypothetical protein